MEIPLTAGFYISDSLPVSHQQCTNWIPVLPDAEALSQRQLIGSEGIRQIATTGSTSDDANRGSWDLAGIPYVVNGGKLYSISRSFPGGVETFTTNEIGTIEGTGRVSMADNGTQLMILVPGGKGYIYSTAGGLVEITDLDFTANGNPQYVVFIDGYFACSTDSKKWIVSALNDGTSWNALDFGTAESDPDNVVAPIVHNNQIFLTGSETTEGFQNIGGAGFPFQRSNIFLDKGCYAPFSLVSTNQRFFMIGGGKNEKAAIWAFSGGSYQKISTTAIDSVLSSYSDNVLAAAYSIAWANRGQYFVAFSFTDRTFVFNMSTNRWHEQKSGTRNEFSDLEQGPWRVASLVTAYGYSIVGDTQDGRLGILDTSIYTEYDTNIIRVFSMPPLAAMGKGYRVPRIELTMEAGVGNEAAPEPLISLAISEDAKRFGQERSRKIGAVGRYGQRTIWRKNGYIPRFGVFRFRLSDPVKPVVIKLEMDAK